jgi:hypothetical protein
VIAKIEYAPLKIDASISNCGRAEDIAHSCLFFASDMSAYVTGMTLMQDGGASYLAHKFHEIPTPDYHRDMSYEYMMSFPYPEPSAPVT